MSVKNAVCSATPRFGLDRLVAQTDKLIGRQLARDGGVSKLRPINNPKYGI